MLDPLNDGKSRIELINYMGGDLDVVNDARGSFNKISTVLTEKDINLINFLANHQPPHSGPFRGVVFKFRVKAPLFTARQWFKHVVASNHTDEQLQWSEQSLRFTEIEDPNEFFIPEQFRRQSQINKQGSAEPLNEQDNAQAIDTYTKQCSDSYLAYKSLIATGVSREDARGVLVPSVYVTWTWTVSLQAVLHFLDLRRGASAQSQIVAYANAIRNFIEPIVPHSLRAWENSTRGIE